MPSCHTYEDTLLQVQDDAERVGLPYRWWLIDSWWHAMSGEECWEGTVEQVGALFPHGLRWLYNRSKGMSFGAHWSSSFGKTSPYLNVTDPSDWSCNTSCIPRSARVWEHIFASAESWGLQTIKVDHLYGSLESNGACFSDPFLAEDFLGGIADGAKAHNVDVMWCMSYPNVLMQSVKHPAATHARASADSHPSGNNFVGFAGESTWIWAVGLWPFKDTFYSNTSELTQNPYAGWEDYCRGEHDPRPTGGTSCRYNQGRLPATCPDGRGEQMPFSHALVSALGGGGVAPGGVVGGADVPLVLMTCRADGVLLKPTVPAMYIDRVWLGRESGLGEIATARTVLQGLAWAFTYRVCAPGVGQYDNAADKSQIPSCNGSSTVALTASDIGLGQHQSDKRAKYVTYRWCGSRPSGRCQNAGLRPSVQPLSDAHPFAIGGSGSSSTPAEADYWLAAPVLRNGWAVLGEAEKLVPVSAQRIATLDTTQQGDATAVSLVATGVPMEEVDMLFADKALQVHAVSCKLPRSGRVRMTIEQSGGGAAPKSGCAEL